MKQMEKPGYSDAEAGDDYLELRCAHYSVPEAAAAMATAVLDNYQAFSGGWRDTFSAYFGLNEAVHAEAARLFAQETGIDFTDRPETVVERRPLPSVANAYLRRQNLARVGGRVLQAEILYVVNPAGGQTDTDVQLMIVDAGQTTTPAQIANQYLG